MHLVVLPMELQGERLTHQELKRENEFHLKSCGIFHPSHDSKECFNPQKLQKISFGMHKKESLMGRCVIHQIPPSWKLIDHKWADFGEEPRNLRLAISADGLNPHSYLSSRHSY